MIHNVVNTIKISYEHITLSIKHKGLTTVQSTTKVNKIKRLEGESGHHRWPSLSLSICKNKRWKTKGS